MLHKTDLDILELLRQNCKLSTMAIARKTNIPPTTVHNRIKRMEKDGVITGYHASVNKKQLGKGLSAYASISVNYNLPSGQKVSQEALATQIATMPEVEHVCTLTGDVDILIKISVAGTDELNNFIVKRLRTMPGVDKVSTSVVLNEFS